MPSVTLTIPEEVRSELKEFSWVNWSEVAREEFIKQKENREAFEQFKKIVSKSEFTEKDADELANKVKSSMHKRYKKLYPELQ